MERDENSEGNVYVPKKIQALATSLVMTGDLDACLAQLRSMYSNLSTLRGSLCKLKASVIATNIRHPDYATTMKTWETLVKDAVVAQGGSPESVQRMQDFHHFQACSLKRQLHIQKKIRLGQGEAFFSHAHDKEFVACLKMAPDYVHRIHLDAEEMRTVQEKQAESVKCLSNTVVRIEHADEIVANARRVLKNVANEDPCAIATAIALTTGRRMVEIFQRGQFTEEPRQRYSLLFTGQAKAGLQEIVSITHNKPLEYSIPVLASAGTIVRAVSKIRGACKTLTMDAKQVNSAWCRKLNAYVKEHVHPELGFHDLRTMYALISYEAFKPHTYSVNAWICKTLGHTGLAMSVAYTRMQVYGLNKLRRHNREAAEDFTTA